MQLTFSCMPQTLENIEKTLSEARLARYLRGTEGDKHHALKVYVWNARLCEAFYLPVQICEVAFRNAIHTALRGKHGDNWYERGGFLCTLPNRLRSELDDVIRTEREAYGRHMNLDHLVSGLSFGFWQNLLTRNYEHVFWPKYYNDSFPHKPGHINQETIYDKADLFRKHRNKIAHHKPIFDRNPSMHYQNIIGMVSWICQNTHWFIKTTSRVTQTINERPPHP